MLPVSLFKENIVILSLGMNTVCSSLSSYLLPFFATSSYTSLAVIALPSDSITLESPLMHFPWCICADVQIFLIVSWLLVSLSIFCAFFSSCAIFYYSLIYNLFYNMIRYHNLSLIVI